MKKPKHFRDLTGQTFTDWSVLYPMERRTKAGGVYWRCRCVCGLEKDVSSQKLVQGESTGCGCSSYKRRREATLKNRIGESRIMSNGLSATIIEYRTCMDMDIRFENGCVVANCTYNNFIKGSLKCPNLIIDCGEYSEVVNPNTGKMFLLDNDDLHYLDGYSWWVSGKGHVESSESGNSILLHRIIMNAPEGMVVDHINGNAYDNRKNNLRLCLQSENTKNRKKGKGNASGYKGVHKRSSGRWYAVIRANGKLLQLGTFDTKKEAAIAYNNAAIKHHGEFARLNEIRLPE